MKDTLLTVSGYIPDDIEEEIAAGNRPVADYLAMAAAFDADLLDYSEASRQAGVWGSVLSWLGGPNLLLAFICFRLNRHYEVIMTDGEQVGILYAFFTRFLGFGRARPHHLMIVHILSVGKKMLFFDWLGIQTHIDRFLCYASWQKQFIEQRWQIEPERVIFTPFMVDDQFFSPAQFDPADPIIAELQALAGGRPIICSVGLEFRDYPTLLKAVDGLDLHLVIAAGSPWSKRADNTAGERIPPNVTVRRFTQYELRQLYGISAFVVMPLLNVQFQAGVTAILEGMAMSRAILCSATPGQTDVVQEGVSGGYVPPEDPVALRQAIVEWLAAPEYVQKLGLAGRQQIEQEMSLTCYVERLADYVRAGRQAVARQQASA